MRSGDKRVISASAGGKPVPPLCDFCWPRPTRATWRYVNPSRGLYSPSGISTEAESAP